jgi:hypothetical protein
MAEARVSDIHNRIENINICRMAIEQPGTMIQFASRSLAWAHLSGCIKINICENLNVENDPIMSRVRKHYRVAWSKRSSFDVSGIEEDDHENFYNDEITSHSSRASPLEPTVSNFNW